MMYAVKKPADVDVCVIYEYSYNICMGFIYDERLIDKLRLAIEKKIIEG